MSTRTKNVAILGASGKIGPFILDALRQQGFLVTVVARASSKASYDKAVKVVRVSDEQTKEEMLSVFSGSDAVVLCFAFMGNEKHHRTLMDAAAEAGVKHFIANHWGCNAELPVVQQAADRNQALDDDVDYLKTKESSGMMWTAIIPGIFFDLAFTFGLLGFNLKNKSVQIWDDGNATFSASTNKDIADTTVAVLLKPEVAKNRYVYTSSFDISQNQILASVERMSGQKWEVQRIKSADKIREAKDKVAAGAQGWDWLMAQGTLAASMLFGGEEYQADFTKFGRSSNADLGLKQRDLDKAVVACLSS